MHKTVKFHQNQQGVFSDQNKSQGHAKQTFDHLIADAVTAQKRYAGFLITKESATVAAVNPGRLYDGGAMYTMEDAHHTIDFFSQLPLSTEKIVAIVAAGSEVETDNEQRKFLMDATTRATQVQTVPTTVHRVATVSTVAGVEAATPTKPTISTGYVTIGWVTLDTVGIKSIEMNAAAKLDSIHNNDIRLDDLEGWRTQTGNRIDTLASDIAGLAQSQNDAGDRGLLEQIAMDVARLKEANELEDGYTDYGADRFLDTSESDVEHVNFLAKVEEGIRYSPEAEDEFALTMFNPLNPNAIVTNGFLLPKYSSKLRLLVDGFQEELSIAQYAFQALEYVMRTMSRTRIQYGESKNMCTNNHWWKSGKYDQAKGIFYKDGETWEVVGNYKINGINKGRRLRKFWIDEYEEVYWDRIVTDHTVNGSVVAQTYLNSQVGWMVAFRLYLNQVGPSGDLKILMCQAEHGKPDPNNVIAEATLEHDDMVVGWNRIVWPATLMEPGQRYGFILSTGGNHYVGLANGSRYAQGTLFYSTDGDFYLGDLTKDLMFGIECAEFSSNRVEIEMDALSLSGGISDIDLLVDMAKPEGSELTFEIQPSGSGVWYPLEEVVTGNTRLHGLPALVKFRAVFTGSPDAHGGINLVTSRMNISRPRTVKKHLSTPITFAGPTQSLKITVLLENFYETNHDVSCEINDVTNAANGIAPATVTDVDMGPDEFGNDVNHRRIRRTFEWTATELTVATSEIVIVFDGATSSALDTSHISERVHLAF